MYLQTEHGGVTGCQPIKIITSYPSYWYTPELSGTYSGGTWTFILWTNSPEASSNVRVELYKVNGDESGATLLGSQVMDANASGTGYHETVYTYDVGDVSLTNQRIMVEIAKDSGEDTIMSFNINDFPTRLVTP